MKRYRTCTAVFFLFLLWQIFALQIENDWLMPYPQDVLQLMVEQVRSSTFYMAVVATIYRAFTGLLASFLLAFLCAAASYRSRWFQDLFYPLLLLTRSVPNISYIIIILLWFGSESSSAIIIFLILFPVIYANLYQGLCHIDVDLKKVIQLYPQPKWYVCTKIYYPLIQSAILSSLSNGLSLGFKVGVMAEILGQVQIGVGRQLNLCRLSYDMTGIFAWTGWIITMLVILDAVVQLLFHFHRHKYDQE